LRYINDWVCFGLFYLIKDSSDRLKLILLQMNEIVQELKFTPKGGQLTSVWKPIQAGIRLTNKSFISLHQELVVSNKDLKFLLFGRVSQDALENVFSQIRSKGVSHPQPSKFRTALKLVCLSNVLYSHPRSNYELDESPSMLDFFKKTQPSKVQEQPSMEENSSTVTSEAVKFLSSDCEMNGLYYLCGWSVKKVVRKLACGPCEKSLTVSHLELPALNNFSMLTLIKSYTKNPLQFDGQDFTTYLCHPSPTAFNFLKHVESIFRSNINQCLLVDDPVACIFDRISCAWPETPPCHSSVYCKLVRSFLKLRFYIHGKETATKQTRQYAGATAAKKSAAVSCSKYP